MLNNRVVKVTKCDNGYVLEWSKPFSETVSPHEPVSGTEVYATLRKALKAAEGYL